MRTREEAREYSRKYRFTKLLESWKAINKKCEYCDSLMETIHHKDEDHSNNKLSNLVPVCREHHLEIPHEIDKEPTATPGRGRKRPEMPQIQCYRPKLVRKYLDSVTSRIVHNVTILDPMTKQKMNVVICRTATLEKLAAMGFSEIIYN